jgi:exodeoxyribonuclease VII large subunit
MTMPTYSLFDLNEHVRRVIALNFSEPIWITAEVAESNLSNGHLYLSLIQKTEPNTAATEPGILAQAQAAVWQRELRKIRVEHGPIAESVLQMGSLVRLLVKVNFHERYGLKLHVLDIDPTYTLGAAALQRRQTIEWLQKEGLLHRNAQLPLPLVLQRVAVITSPEAAGFHDFKAHLEENSYGYHFKLTFFFTSVQGKNAEKEIVAALNEITHRHNQFDVAVIVRGGGSKLDLLAFDDRNMCSTVGKMPIPVFSGIGHEIDEAVLDLTAHTSFKTPTAVAQFLIERSAQFETTINQIIAQVGKEAYFQAQTAYSILNSKQLALQFSAQNTIIGAGQHIQQLQEKIELSVQHQLVKEKQLLAHSENIVTALSPATILQRGYSLTLVNGQIIRNHTAVQKGDQLETRLASGSILSRVE